LVVQRETEKEANVERLMELKGKTGRIHLQALLNQKEGKIVVFSSSEEAPIEMKVVSNNQQTYGGLQLLNRGGDMRLERLQIGRWNGEPPQQVERDKTRIHDVDGTITYGTLKSYDSTKREFEVANDEQTQTISEDRVQDIVLAQASTIIPTALRAVYLT